MSDTVKLIIEMSKEDYEFTKGAETARVFPPEYYVGLILDGTPLDDIKAEITALRYGSDTYKNAIDDVIDVLDDIGKGE